MGGGRERGKGRRPSSKKGSQKKYGAAKNKRTNQRKTPYTKRAPARRGAPSMVSVTNLDKGVTEKDLKEIFSNVGKVKAAVLHYNAKGKSRGTGMVYFFNKSSMHKACNEYNQAEVDGKPMYVKAVTVLAASDASPKRKVSKKKVTKKKVTKKKGSQKKKRPEQSPRRKSSQKKGGRGGKRGKGRGRGQKSKPVTVDQLDKEMEDYMNMDTSSGASSGQPASKPIDLVAAGQPVMPAMPVTEEAEAVDMEE